MGVEISPATFNLGHVSEGSSTCAAGASADPSLTGSTLAVAFPVCQADCDMTQTSGFLGTFSSKTSILLGMSATSKLDLPPLRDYF